MRRMRTGALVVVVLLSGVIVGCGATGSFKAPTFPSVSAGPGTPDTTAAGHGDAATFVIDGGTISVVQSGSISVHYSDVPQLSYSGPLGCRGRYFTADYSEHIQILFHYSARDAYLLIGQDLYRFAGRPRRRSGRLSWAHRFSDRLLAVTVACPPPPPHSRL
ncbi:MAG: hypothetical protein ACXVFQ_24820 [Solirubrobacteraceae bacterium]